MQCEESASSLQLQIAASGAGWPHCKRITFLQRSAAAADMPTPYDTTTAGVTFNRTNRSQQKLPQSVQLSTTMHSCGCDSLLCAAGAHHVSLSMAAGQCSATAITELQAIEADSRQA
jgi:hypothetical protein